MAQQVYLDHNATTPLHPEVRQAMRKAFDLHGNPSSIHGQGRRSREAVERARMEVALLIGAKPEEIVFTSGGTEACNLALSGVDGPVVTSAMEHPAVLGAVSGRARLVAVDGHGRIDADDVACALPGASRCSLQWANHEVGNLNPVQEVARRCRSEGVPFFCDAVQAAGKVRIDVALVDVDLLALSAHKIFGPKGSGALFVRRGFELGSLLRGGHQEKGRRPGTENLIGIVGMGVACDLARRELDARREVVCRLARRFEVGLLALGARLHGDRERRVPGTVNVAFAGVAGDAVVQALDLMGICASTGAACTSGSVAASPVLLAMGVPEQAALEAVRFSLGPDHTDEDIDHVVAALPRLLERIRRYED